MKSLEDIFYKHKGNIIHKWKHYFEIYDKHFSRFRGKSPVILEIGIYKGGSLEMWKEYFGEGVKIAAIDINPACKRFEEDDVKVFIGSQEDEVLLEQIKKELPHVDIIIDDGGHTMSQMKTSFKFLYSLVQDNGIYMVEDTHTCYWHNYDGGKGRSSTFIEYSKKLIDEMHDWYIKPNNVAGFARSIHGIHFYDSIIVFEKKPKTKPETVFSGKIDEEDIISLPPTKSGWKYFKYLFHKYTSINIP